MKKFTYDEVKHFIEIESGSDCKLLSYKYKSITTNMLFECSCGNTFETSFTVFKFKNKRQCNDCGYNRTSKSLAKTTNEFKKDVYKLVGNEYVFLEEYKTNKIKIKCRHTLCNHTWNVRPDNFLNGTRCPNCYGAKPKTSEKFLNECYELSGDEYKFLGKYINKRTKILCKHNRCGYEWNVLPGNFLKGTGCPMCYGTFLKTNQEFTDEVYNLVGDEYKFLEEYVKADVPILCKHNKCKFEWRVNPNNFLKKGGRCPQCGSSKGESLIGDILTKNKIDFNQEYSFNNLIGIGGGLLRFDFAVFKNDEIIALIEYDGVFHFKENYFGDNFDIIKNHDNRKNQYCKDNNIPLVRIPYWQFDKIEQILNKWLHKYNLLIT